MARKRKALKDRSKLQIERSFEQEELRRAREEMRIAEETAAQIANFENEMNSCNDRSEKMRLDRKHKKKKSNPNAKNPWKYKKTWQHQEECFDHLSKVEAQQKAEKII